MGELGYVVAVLAAREMIEDAVVVARRLLFWNGGCC
jgi:hypothetical protein